MAVEDSEISNSEFITFLLGRDEYAINILNVQEIKRYGDIKHVAKVPEYVKGVINLRGIIIPIIDLRIFFDLTKYDYNEFTVIIILNLNRFKLGFIVDSVSDVVTLKKNEIKPLPPYQTLIHSSLLSGFGVLSDRTFLIIDVDKLLAAIDLMGVEQEV